MRGTAGPHRTRRMGAGGLLAVLALCVGAASVAATQAAPDFAELAGIVDAGATPDPGAALLFLPLDASFGDCVPLSTPCPPASSTVMVVPARGRQVTWRPEGGDLHTIRLDGTAVRAIGTPPERYESVVYLLPVLDGAGIQLSHAPKSYDVGRLVDAGTDDDEAPASGGGGTGEGAEGSGSTGEGGEGDGAGGTPSGREAVTPVLAGPLLSTAAPAPAPERILLQPVVVEAKELDDASPALLVRRSAPNRIVFGVRPDPSWGLETAYLPLLDEAVVAVAARHDGEVGLAIPLPPGVDRLAVRDRTSIPGDDDEGPSPSIVPAIAIGAAALAVVAIAGLGVRRARRGPRRDADPPGPVRPG